MKVADSVTTDHISLAGAIAADSPAARYLSENGVSQKDFNSYGSRRGNDRVMTRAHLQIFDWAMSLHRDEGGWTTYFGADTDLIKKGDVTSIYDASMAYQNAGTPLVILAGTDYGMGSSRDWAAKGTFLLGVRAVIAESYERIHRSNLVGMGVLPLQFEAGQGRKSLGLSGTKHLALISMMFFVRDTVTVTATKSDGTAVSFKPIVD